MITITIRGLHLAILGAFLAGILIAGGVVFALGGGGDSPSTEGPSAANIDEAPTAVPTTAPTSTPAPQPTPEPTAAPQIRTCAEIRATGTYNSDEERAFFLANCTTQTTSGGAPPPQTAPSSAGATAEEQNYRTKADAVLVVMASRLQQWFDTLGNNAPEAKFYEFGTVLRGSAQELDRLPTPPARFAQAHFALRGQLLTAADHIIAIQQVTTQKQYYAWLKKYFETFEALDAALQDYALVVGIKLPSLFTE